MTPPHPPIPSPQERGRRFASSLQLWAPVLVIAGLTRNPLELSVIPRLTRDPLKKTTERQDVASGNQFV